MPESGAGDFSPDGKRPRLLAAVRATSAPGSATRAAGPRTSSSSTSRPATRHGSPTPPRAERDPMWIGDTIYFTSDRDGTLNLYALRPGERSSRSQLTQSTTWDVRWPSSDSRRPHRLRAGRRAAACSTLKTRARARRSRSPCPTTGCATPAVAGVGREADRGLRPVAQGRARAVRRRAATSSPRRSRRARAATSPTAPARTTSGPRWSPDGSRIAFISDRTGEEELYVVAQDGPARRSSSPRGGQAMRYAPQWSPDGKRTRVLATRTARVCVLTVRRQEAGARSPTTARDPGARLRVVAAAAAYLPSADGPQRLTRSIHVWSGGGRQAHGASRTRCSTTSEPAWDPDGKYPLLPERPRVRAADHAASSGTSPATARPASTPSRSRKDVKHPSRPRATRWRRRQRRRRRRPTKDRGRRQGRPRRGEGRQAKKDDKPAKHRSRSTSTAWRSA